MVRLYPEFFNDVFGPIMQPGSSSHTAGPCRLGRLAHDLLNVPLRSIRIVLNRDGSFAGTFGHMNEDLGMLAGAYGLLPDDERLFDIRRILKAEDIPFSFEFSEISESSDANAVKFILTGTDNRAVSLVGISTGGGMVETVQILGFPYRSKGDAYLTCIRVPGNSGRLDSFLRSAVQRRGTLGMEAVGDKTSGTLFCIQSEAELSDLKTELKSFPEAEWFQMRPLLPVITTERKERQLFNTFTDWIRISRERGQGLAETAIDYERDASGWTREKVVDYMKMVQRDMKKQTEAVYEDDSAIFGNPFSGYHFRKWSDYLKNGPLLAGDTVGRALYYAFGVQAMVRGVKMVPGPMGTGGGFLYSAFRAVKEAKHVSDEAVLRGLFVAAGVGAICYTRTQPTGEVIGCTGECGVCAAMASAGLTEMMGGEPDQAEAAASLVLQAAIGWPCDPIPGGDNQPCLSRVVTAVTMAIVFADLALSGRQCVIPFHEVVDVAGRLGKAMPVGLKCTSCGGLCLAPAALDRKKKFAEWRDRTSPPAD